MKKNYEAQIVQNKIWIKSEDQIWCYDLVDVASEGARRKKTLTQTPDKINSLMPGKITKIFVKENESVQPGQALVVMEAMKMEYTLKSDLVAQVEKINISVGDQVSLGQLLIQLKKVEN